MKKSLILIPMLLLAGCFGSDTGLAPAIQIPPLPYEVSQKAGQLTSNSDLTMGGQVTDNTSNIRAYNKVSHQTNTLIDIYNCVRESINNKKEPKCL